MAPRAKSAPKKSVRSRDASPRPKRQNAKPKTRDYPLWSMDDDEYLMDADDYITDCARFYSFQQLEHDIGAVKKGEPLTMRVAGMDDAKQRLFKSIVQPLRAPQHYQHGGGNLTFDRTLMIYGAEGSGKRLLVRTFCAEHRINLIVVSHIGFDPVNDIPTIYNKAAQCEPCIVLFDDCNGFFRPNGDPRIIAKLNRELSVMRDRLKQVWSVFISIEKSEHGKLHHMLATAIDHSVWAGSRESNDMHNEGERSQLFAEAIGRYLYNDYNPFTPVHIRQLISASRHCTAGNIFAFVDRVWRAKADSLDTRQFHMLERDSPELVPEWEVFESSMTRAGGGRCWIVPFDPYVHNVQPYGTAPAHVNNDFEDAWAQ